MAKADITWVRYTWQLPGKTFVAAIPPGYAIRLARAAERGLAGEISVAAYASDPIWAPMMPSIRRRMTKRVEDTFGVDGSAFICATHNDMPIAVSGVTRSHWTQQNFLTGICVLPGHQRRGLGICLLSACLSWLRDSGIDAANVFTELGSIADRSIYPKFGSTRLLGVDYPDPPTVGI